MAHPQIAIFARLAGENAKPTRVLAGQKTHLRRTMHDIRYDEVHDEIFVPSAGAILVFRGAANGEEAPIRVIQGPSTGGGSSRLEVDPVHNELFVPKAGGVSVFPRDANGNVAPIRVLGGPDVGFRNASSVAVDPVRNLLAVGVSTSGGPEAPEEEPEEFNRSVYKGYNGRIVVFNRTDSGNTKPRSVIVGPKTEIIRILQLQLFNGWIIATQPGRVDEQEPENVFVGIWSINDNGDVPPRWKLGGPKSTLKKPRGVVLNPKNKEVIVADMRLNAVLTYYFPELF